MKNLFYPSRILAEGSRGEGQCRIFAPETLCDASKKKVKLILINSLMHLIRLDVLAIQNLLGCLEPAYTDKALH